MALGVEVMVGVGVSAVAAADKGGAEVAAM